MKIYLPVIVLLTLFSCEETSKINPETKLQKDKVFVGSNLNGNNLYDCSLLIKSDSSIILVGSTPDISIYFERMGKIEQVKDSIYLIKSIGKLFGGPMEDHEFNDKMQLDLDKLNIKSINLIYSDGSKEKVTCESRYFRLPFDQSRLSKKNENLGLDIGHLNPITKKKVVFNAWYGSGYEFSNASYPDAFFVIIKGNQLRTINTAPSQCGHIQLNYKTQ